MIEYRQKETSDLLFEQKFPLQVACVIQFSEYIGCKEYSLIIAGTE
jgi:hypothetical protein